MVVLNALSKPEKASETIKERKKAHGPVRNTWAKSFLKECDDLCQPEPRNGEAGHSYDPNCQRDSTTSKVRSQRRLQPRGSFRVPTVSRGAPCPPTKGPSLTDLCEGSRSLVSPPLSMFNCGNATKINHKTWVTDEKHEKVPQSPPDGSKCGRVGEASSSRRPTLALYPVPGPRPAARRGPLHSPDGATPHGICCGDTVSLQAPATRSPEPIFIYTEECQVPLRVHRTNPGCLSIFPGDREALAKVTA